MDSSEAMDAGGGGEARDRFLANMGHALRTPLTAVTGLLDLLAATDLDATQAAYVAAMRESAGALRSIVQGTLTLAQADAGAVTVRPEAVDLADFMAVALKHVATDAMAKGVKLEQRMIEPLPEGVRVDPLHLAQVVHNLLVNAVKFTDAGWVRLEAGWRDGTLRCQVEDTGRGFPPEEKARLLRPFEQAPDAAGRHAEGAGLGLAVCDGLVKAMGGTLDATGRPGAGACFWFELPCPAQATAGKAGPASPVAAKALQVLVVEDNPAIQRLLRHVLEAAGHRVSVAENGAEGVAALRRHPFDIALMDLRMPVLDGVRATGQIRADADPRVRATPVLALSADVMEGEGDRMAAAGFDGFLAKPVDAPALLQAIQRLCGARVRAAA